MGFGREKNKANSINPKTAAKEQKSANSVRCADRNLSSALRRLRQEDGHKFKASLCYTVRTYHNTNERQTDRQTLREGRKALSKKLERTRQDGSAGDGACHQA